MKRINHDNTFSFVNTAKSVVMLVKGDNGSLAGIELEGEIYNEETKTLEERKKKK